jgi:serine/threonine-protein kinase HipA
MRKCEVLVHGIVAGVLTETDAPRTYRFEYADDYLRQSGPQVCLAMPLRREAYCSDVLFPFFFNMLSEGENRALQSAVLHIDKDDDFGILLETAQYDTAGAVTVRPLNE